jgi:hypothetical protein
MTIARSTTRGLATAISSGLLAGVLAKLADQSTWRWATDLGTYPSAWIFALVVIAVIASSALRAGFLGGAFSVAAIVSYYAWSAIVLGFSVGLFPLLWMSVALVIAPVFAATIWIADQRGGIPSAIAAAGVGGIMLADGPIQQFWNELTIGLPDDFPFHPVQAVFGVVFAVATIGMLVDSGRWRVAAAALTVPLAVVASFLIGTLRSAVGF